MCESEVIGLNKFQSVPKEIAIHLKLKDPSRYTSEYYIVLSKEEQPAWKIGIIILNPFIGHSFRRTSATLLANAGADLIPITIKRHGGWKSTAAAERYIEDSITYKQATAILITSLMSANASPNNESCFPQNQSVFHSTEDNYSAEKVHPNLKNQSVNFVDIPAQNQ